MNFEPNIYKIKKIFEFYNHGIKKEVLWDGFFLEQRFEVKVYIEVYRWNYQKIHSRPLLNLHTNFKLGRCVGNQLKKKRNFSKKFWGLWEGAIALKSWNLQKENLESILNLHINYQLFRSIWRGDMREIKSKK